MNHIQFGYFSGRWDFFFSPEIFETVNVSVVNHANNVGKDRAKNSSLPFS
jgi:hypothetical protein